MMPFRQHGQFLYAKYHGVWCSVAKRNSCENKIHLRCNHTLILQRDSNASAPNGQVSRRFSLSSNSILNLLNARCLWQWTYGVPLLIIDVIGLSASSNKPKHTECHRNPLPQFDVPSRPTAFTLLIYTIVSPVSTSTYKSKASSGFVRRPMLAIQEPHIPPSQDVRLTPPLRYF